MAKIKKATAVANVEAGNKVEYTVDDLKALSGVASDEQETTVQMSRTEDVAHVWTNDNTVITKIRKLMVKAPDQWKLVRVSTNAAGEAVGYFIECPKKMVAFRVPRVYDEDGKAAIAARLASGRAKDSTDDEEDE